MYNKILKELEKGNALVLEVSGVYDDCLNRHRLITPESCEYTNNSNEFETSCFTKFIIQNPKSTIKAMQNFDRLTNLKVTGFQIL
jgi:hypothetical protein